MLQRQHAHLEQLVFVLNLAIFLLPLELRLPLELVPSPLLRPLKRRVLAPERVLQGLQGIPDGAA